MRSDSKFEVCLFLSVSKITTAYHVRWRSFIWKVDVPIWESMIQKGSGYKIIPFDAGRIALQTKRKDE